MSETIIFEAKNLRIHAVRDNKSEQPIVSDINFRVRRGQVVALIGESGSGKTTIALSALGYCRPGLKFAGGGAFLVGEDLTKLAPQRLRQLRGEKVAYLAQSAAATFNPALKINEQVTEAPVLHGSKSRAEANKKALQLYRALELPNPDTIGDRYPHEVSGGQLQRLMAAMALCGSPELLVLDEPTTALDVTTQIEVLKTFKKVIREEGAAGIYVSHDLAVVAQIADHIVVLYKGEIQEKGPVGIIVNAPQHPYTKQLLAAVRPTPAAGQGNVNSGPRQQEVPALEAKSITAGYGKGTKGEPFTEVLRAVSFAIQRGHTVGIIGESGCGKSTLARVMAGILPAVEGEVLLDGVPLQPSLRNRNREELRKVQIVFQMADTALNPRQRIADILGRPLQFYFGMKGEQRNRRIAQLLELVELPAQFSDRYPDELSGGQKQRINLARAMAAQPEVMICDEVTSALDTIVGANIIETLKRLRRETGVSFMFISHDLSTVAAFADEIVVLYGGRAVEKGPTDQVLSPPYHPYTRLLISSAPEVRIGWLEKTIESREVLAGIARPVNIKRVGCSFFNRCPLAIVGTCDKIDPPQRFDEQGRGHVIACHLEFKETSAALSAPAKAGGSGQSKTDLLPEN